MSDAPPKPKRIKEPEARTAYLALGPSRTLRALEGALKARCGSAPSLATIERWSARNRWTALAADHDIKAGERAGELIVQAQGRELARAEITPDRVIQEMARIGFANMGDFITVQSDGSAVLDLTVAQKRPDLMAAIQEITVDEYTEGRGDAARDVKRVRVKLHPKIPALEKLGEHLGIWKGAGAQPPPLPPSDVHVHINGMQVLVQQVKAEVLEIFADRAPHATPELPAPDAQRRN